MRAEDFLQIQFNSYPIIYGSRKILLCHIFCGCGNGYEWNNGEITYKHYDSMSKSKDTVNNYNIHVNRAEPTKEAVELLNKNISMVEKWKNNPRTQEAYNNFYNQYLSLSEEYSLIYHVPNDVKLDWLNVCYEVVDYMKEDGIDISSIKLPKIKD